MANYALPHSSSIRSARRSVRHDRNLQRPRKKLTTTFSRMGVKIPKG